MPEDPAQGGRALLVREQANLDQVGEETVSLVPVMTDPVFV